MAYRLAADIGGTFTDIVLVDDETGEYRTNKVLTTPEALERGILKGFDEIVHNDYSQVTSIVHGTTAGLNALIERRGAHCALLTTKGFRDVYEIARVNRPEIYNIHYRRPTPLIPRKDIFEVDERVLCDGTIEKEVTEERLQPIIERIKGRYEAVAICFLNSYMNIENERKACELLRKALGEKVIVTASCDIAYESREYERVSTSVLNAYIAPTTRHHVEALAKELEQRGFHGSLYMMQSSGGVIRAELAAYRAVKTIMSGPVGGAIGASVMNRKDIITFDIGGTSFDVSVVLNNRIDTSAESMIEGFPALTPTVNVNSIGAGGGSIAWAEAGGMRVGPQSAGAVPGPVCYDRGGEKPTVTDANLILGHLAPNYFLGGRMKIETEKTRRVMENYGRQFGLSAVEVAEGICTIANHKMANAIREMTVNRGMDPRDFSILAFGGAGPMHAAEIAEELEIDEVIVPANSGVFSAWGMLQADIRHDVARTRVCLLDQLDEQGYLDEFAKLRANLQKELELENLDAAKGTFLYTLEMRYQEQDYTIQVDIPQDMPFSREKLAELFSSAYERLYGHHSPDECIEVVNYRMAVMIPIRSMRVIGKNSAEVPIPIETLTGYFGGKAYEMSVYSRDEFGIGTQIQGPAIVTELTATTVVPPSWTLQVDHYNNMVMTRQKN